GVGGLGMAANVGAAPAGAGLMSGADPAPLAAYVYDNSPDNEAVYDASFYFNPNGFESGDTPVDVFVGLDQNSLPVFGIQYEKEDAEQELRAWVLQGGKQVFTQSVKVPDGEHLVELAWVSDAKAKFSLFLDDKLVGTVTGDTSGHLLNEDLMGVVTGVTKSTSGSMYFDEFTSSRTLGVANNKVFLPWMNK
ncbi:MAG TPA: hypothetical protein PJ988_22610, partial [Anaerolinea sp.]|nr:hypothetical protein [Anaerolinea sp.]